METKTGTPANDRLIPWWGSIEVNPLAVKLLDNRLYINIAVSSIVSGRDYVFCLALNWPECTLQIIAAPAHPFQLEGKILKRLQQNENKCGHKLRIYNHLASRMHTGHIQ